MTLRPHVDGPDRSKPEHPPTSLASGDLPGAARGGNTSWSVLASGFYLCVASETEVHTRRRRRGSGSQPIRQFRGQISAVWRASRRIMLLNGTNVVVDLDTCWAPYGDLVSFDELIEAALRGESVMAVGRGRIRPDGSFLAHRLEIRILR